MAVSTIIRKTYEEPSKENTQSLIKFLDEISGNELKIAYIRQYLFKTTWKGKEDIIRSRCHLKAASTYMKYLIENDLSKEQNRNALVTTIADISPYVNKMKEPNDPTFSIGSTNDLPSTVHYGHAKKLFFDKTLLPTTNGSYSFDLTTLYILRLSIEKRIKGILGLDFIKRSTKNTFIGLKQIINIAKKLKTVKYDESINWHQIIWVNDWLNHHIHRNLRPYPWVIYQSILVLDTILEIVEHNGGYSYYGSSVTTDKVILRQEIEDEILHFFPDASIFWANTHKVREIKQL